MKIEGEVEEHSKEEDVVVAPSNACTAKNSDTEMMHVGARKIRPNLWSNQMKWTTICSQPL